ncbi:Fic family protein [Demequina sp. TTPB684]|uniref:Fic family protein n=1 Tax=unclassified Demequina TaxID=2620311 RepID=UPI001CF5D366|nr:MULTISPECIES: Fic family protein [unclassified Demequina]MCB2412152.1 Fic family protein [Demequina sp. TTPB684]UPU88587.1 Fic family protein [Demequina sp. TMPB413]
MPQSATVHGAERLLWSIDQPWPSGPREYRASVVPTLARLVFEPDPDAAVACREATIEIALLERGPAGRLPGFQGFLERTEALASCRIDGATSDPTQLAQAEAGVPASTAGKSVREAATGLAILLESARRAISLGAIAAAHQPPPTGDPGWRDKVAHYRDAQTWIGGTDLWPDGADYVPPQPARISDAMEDLVAFASRKDIDPIAQAAIAHAQFLSIQPFTSGNGRTARALVNGVLRRRGVTSDLAVPLSASIAGQKRAYAMDWKAYRIGDADAVVESIGIHLARAAKEAADSAARLAALPEAWRQAARPRRHSAAARLIPLLVAHPIVDAADVQRLTGASPASAYEAIAKLAEAGVLRRLTRTRRDTVWAAADVIDESDHFMTRLASA